METKSATHLDVSLLKMAVNDCFQKTIFFLKVELFGSDCPVRSPRNLKARKSAGDSWLLLATVSVLCPGFFFVAYPTVISLSYCGTS